MFRFHELELHGWDFWTSFRVPLDAEVVILSGPNGSGKTTILDAVRQLLYAPRLSQSRRLAHYLRQPNFPALLRAVVSNKPDGRGHRPFDRQRVFTDDATLACALIPDGGSPEKRYVVLPGRVSAPDLQKQLLEGRDWLAPEEYRRVLEYAGVSRSLMHILALEQGRVDELSHKKPRELFRWVMEARASQQILERYRGARERYEDSIREVERQRRQLLMHETELAELDRKVRRLNDHCEKHERVLEAARILVGAQLQERLVQLSEIERRLPEARSKATNLSTSIDRLSREVGEARKRVMDLHDKATEYKSDVEALEAQFEQAVRQHTLLDSQVTGMYAQREELLLLPLEDLESLEKAVGTARETALEVKQRCEQLASSLDDIDSTITQLEKGVPRFPVEVERTCQALGEANIRARLIAPDVDVIDDAWAAAIESALGPLRYALCVAAVDEDRATTLARQFNFPGPIVSETVEGSSAVGPLQVSGSVPSWLFRWARDVRLAPELGDAGEVTCVTQDGTRRDTYGVWVSHADVLVLGGHSVRSQLESARRQRESICADAKAATKQREEAIALERDLDARKGVQQRRRALADAISGLSARETLLDEAARALETARQKREAARAALQGIEHECIAAEAELPRKQDDLNAREKERETTLASIAQMEEQRVILEPEVGQLDQRVDARLRVKAERGELPSSELAERDAAQARDALVKFELEGPIPNETVREEQRLLLRNIEEMHRHIEARQQEADVARLELDRCRGDYLEVVRSTLHDYARRARMLAELATAKLEVELPHLQNDDRVIDEAGIIVRIGFDGKPATEITDTSHSGGQQVISGLILLMAMAETDGDSFFIVDEPFAHLSLDRIDDVGRFLRRCGSQFLLTVPTTLDRGQLDSASLMIVLTKKQSSEQFAPRPIVARA